MFKRILAALVAALTLVIMTGCATQPPAPAQVACQLSQSKTVYTNTEADCAGLLQALGRQQQPPQASAQPAAYCPMKNNTTGEIAKVYNPERRSEFCKEVEVALRSGNKKISDYKLLP